MTDWRIYQGDGVPDPKRLDERPAAPPWRQFDRIASSRAENFKPPKGVVEAINAALYLRRPLLVTGDPGTGKSSLAYAVAHELGLGDGAVVARQLPLDAARGAVPLRRDWRGSATANLQRRERQQRAVAAADPETSGDYITLGAIGTAFCPRRSRGCVLIDEIDKSDIDLPNDLLHVFENGRFEIPEIARIARTTPSVEVRPSTEQRVPIDAGVVGAPSFRSS